MDERMDGWTRFAPLCCTRLHPLQSHCPKIPSGKQDDRVMLNRQQKAVWASDTLALLSSECNGIESEQGSGSKGDTVLYNTWLLRNVNIFVRFGLKERREGLGREEGWEGKRGVERGPGGERVLVGLGREGA